MEAAGPAVPGRPTPRFLMPVLGACGVVAALMQTIVVPLLPDLPRFTGSSPATVSWTVTATLLSGAVCTPLLGRAGDMFGKRRMLLLVMAVLAAGSLLCAVSSDIAVLLVGRALQGTATAVVPLGISVLRDELPPERAGSAVALMSSTLGVGAAVGLPLAGLLVDVADWHVMFWVATALALAVLALVAIVVPRGPARVPERFDIPGALGLSATLVCLLLAVSKGTAWGWSATRTLALLGAALVLGVLWGIHQTRATAPLVDLRLSATRAVLIPNIAALFIGFAFYANSLTTAQLVQTPKESGYGLGVSVAVGGLCLLPGGVMLVLLSPLSARLSATRGPRVCLALGAAVLAAGYVVRLFTSRSLWTIVLGATVVSAGTALCYSALPMLILRAVPSGHTAAATGVNTLMRTVGQGVCSAVVAAVLTAHTLTVSGRELPSLHGYQVAFVLAGAAAGLALLACLCLPPDRDGGRAPDAAAKAGAASEGVGVSPQPPAGRTEAGRPRTRSGR